MKRKEREHLKEDPFQEFIEKVLEQLRKYKKPILLGIGAVFVLVVVLVLLNYFRVGSISSDNELYAEALKIEQSTTLKPEEKIEKLNQLDTKRGVSSSIKLTLASLYFEKGEIQKAQEVLAQFPGSRYRIINDKRDLLEAELLNASEKSKEALDKISAMFSDPECLLAKDYLLFRMARIQSKAQQVELAINNLKKLQEEYPSSMYRTDAQNLLNKLKK